MPDIPSDEDFSLEGQNVIVLGMARQGKALAHWLPTQGAQVILSDTKDAGALADDILEFIMNPQVSFALGGHPVELLDNADMLCISGGVPLNIPIVQEARVRGIRVTNDATLFIERCPATIVGVTGSAGKTTTTTLIGEMLKLTGRKTWVGGNIGQVLLPDLAEIRREDVIIMELSSFQLELMDISPPIALLLNITPNHLDRHGTLERYTNAKAHIFRHQHKTDILIYNHDNLLTRQLSEEAPAELASFSTHELVAHGVCLVGDRLVVNGDCSANGQSEVICTVEDIALRGTHNIQNILAACATAGILDVSTDMMREVIQTFKGVPHRLEYVDTVREADWYNDSIATSPERVIAALNSFTEPIILLLGGRDKNLPWEELARLAVQKCKIICCFGEHGEAIHQVMKKTKEDLGILNMRIYKVTNLDTAVSYAARSARKGDVVLLSPGCTSYDAYTNFAERGDAFRKLVAKHKSRRS